MGLFKSPSALTSTRKNLNTGFIQDIETCKQAYGWEDQKKCYTGEGFVTDAEGFGLLVFAAALR